MQKRKTFFTALALVMLALLILSGCQVSTPGEANYPILGVENGSESLNRTIPLTKVVTVYDTMTREIPSDMAQYAIASIKGGCYSKEYNDGQYKGTLKSVDCSIISAVQVGQTIAYRYTFKVTYKGTVNRIAPLPESKAVTLYDTKTREIPSDMLQYTIASIKGGCFTKDYNDGQYKGTLKSVDCSIISAVQVGQTVAYKYTFKVTYKGTAYLIQ